MCNFSLNGGNFRIGRVFSALHLAPFRPMSCPSKLPSITATQALSIPNVIPAAMLRSRKDSSASNDPASGQMLQGISFPCIGGADHNTHPLASLQLVGPADVEFRQCDRFSLPPHFAPPSLGPCSTAFQPQGGRLRPIRAATGVL